MKLARLAILHSEDGWGDLAGKRMELAIDELHVEALGWVDDTRMAVVATLPVAEPSRALDALPDGLDAEISSLDGALWLVASALTVSRRSRFDVFGAAPFLGFVGDIDDLPPHAGKVVGLRAAQVSLAAADEIDPLLLVAKPMADRFEGIALLAEAVSEAGALGRYSQFLRLFERAFERGIGKFDREIQDYLSGEATRHHFERSEIADWLENRGRALHADREGAPRWYRRDAALIVDRMHEAAVDVLFNKRNWGKADSERRSERVPRRGTANRSGGVFVTSGLDMKLATSLFDPFGGFPLFAAGSLERAVPFGLWTMPSGDKLVLALCGQGSGDHAAAHALGALELDPPSFAGGQFVAYGPDDDTVRPLDDEPDDQDG